MEKARLGRMPIWRVRVPVSPESEEAVSCLMEETLGVPASVYTDARSERSWATAYLAKARQWTPGKKSKLTEGLRCISQLGLSLPRIQINVARLAPEDWAESWKRHFKPLVIGRNLLILPSWSRRRPAKGQQVVILDPGLSFGTGQHPTTRFCLEQLVEARRRRQAVSILDIGCGSGILAIAAAKIGYQRVEAFDFDPVAVRAAQENASQNHLKGKIRMSRRDLKREPLREQSRFDVVCANLTSDLLVEEASKITARLSRNGRLIVAGILRSQFGEVVKRFEKEALALVKAQTKGEWRSGVFAAR